MLVISRQLNQALVIGHDIVVTVVDIRGDKVRLGITSPQEMPVHRREVYDAIRRQDQSQRPDPDVTLRTQNSENFPMRIVEVPLVRNAAGALTFTLSAESLARLDELREASELTREEALETLLEVVAQAQVTSLCELERRLES